MKKKKKKLFEETLNVCYRLLQQQNKRKNYLFYFILKN